MRRPLCVVVLLLAVTPLAQAQPGVPTYAAGQIDGRYADAIEADFTQWLRQNIDRLPVARPPIEEILKQR
jgi:hypothetical protein